MSAQTETELTDVKIGLDGPSRDLEGARNAFENRDVAASKAAHDKTSLMGGAAPSAEEKHGGAGSEYLKSIVYGGLDGIVTTFAVVAASAGANLGMDLLLLMGFASLIADGISMGFGDYLSSKAELAFQLKEKSRETWEYDNYLEGEKKEMVELYVKKGMTEEDATVIIEKFATYKEMFVDLMVVEELGMLPPDEDDEPWKNGLVTFLSFLAFGSVPLWFYVGFYAAGVENASLMFAIDCIATGFTLFLLGAFKANFTNQNKFRSGFGMLGNGSIAAVAAYLTGWALEVAFAIDTDVQ